jgi:hypothetical protein
MKFSEVFEAFEAEKKISYQRYKFRLITDIYYLEDENCYHQVRDDRTGKVNDGDLIDNIDVYEMLGEGWGILDD